MSEGRSRTSPRADAVILESLGDFWCEAAVLVGVFGLLDEVLRHDSLSLAWAAKTVGYVILLSLAGMACRIWARSR